MSTAFDLSVPHLRKAGSLHGGFERVASAVRLVFEVWSEAKQQAYEAQRRYPFTSW